VFVTTSTQHGGIETTCTATFNTFAHHVRSELGASELSDLYSSASPLHRIVVIWWQGMVIMPLGYTHEYLSDMDEIVGGSPYGAGSISRADGKRDPSPRELEIARTQGRRVAELTRQIVAGRRLLAPPPAASS